MADSTDQKIWTRQTVDPAEFISPLKKPAKGVGVHVILVFDEDLRGQSVICLWDSHGQLDAITTACPPHSIHTICDIACDGACNVTTSPGNFTIPPGLYIQAIGAVKECC